MSKRRGLLVGLLGVVAVAALFAGWYIFKPQPPDMSLVMEHNTRGVGLMDRFEYEQAQAEFEQIIKLAPNWMPGHVNLGISLLNQVKPEKVDRAIKEFELVLKDEPDNLHVHFCLGFIKAYHKNYNDAVPHYRRVTQLDPGDAGTWYHLGYVLTQQDGADEAEITKCFEEAHRLNPYMSGPLNNLVSRVDAPERQRQLEEEDKGLRAAGLLVPNTLKYTEQGSKYARAIGTPQRLVAESAEAPSFSTFDKFEVKLPPGARWAGPNDLGTGSVGDLRRLVRRRFGATMITLDFNRDGRPDLFLLGAVIENGKLRDLLLRNDGGGVFTDVTAAAGLAGERASLGCAAADFDNDKFPDLVITGAGRQYLFRNKGDGTFEDVSAKAGLDKLTEVCLGCAWVDIDQDGDLDLLIARYTDTVENAVAAFAGREAASGGIAVYVNTGKAPPVPSGSGFGALSVAFKRSDAIEKAMGVAGHAVALAVTDADNDVDMDVIALADLKPAALVVNDRLHRFRHQFLEAAATGQMWNGVLTLDVAQAMRTDLVLLAAGQAPLLLRNEGKAGTEPAKIYAKAALNSPPLRQAGVVDIDLDGWPDVVGLTDDGHIRLLRNNRKNGFAEAMALPGTEDTGDLIACLALDVDGDDVPGLLAWHDTKGLVAWRGKGNGNRSVKLRLVGRRENANPPAERVNNDAVGARVTVQVGGHWTTAEHATASAGLGQSSQPLLFGLGTASPEKAVVRLRWPDMVTQAEFLDDPKGEFAHLEKGNIWEVQQTNRKPTSCPLLLTWDGEQWVYITDFLGEGSVGEMQVGGGTRVARPEESVKIEAHQLRLKDGRYMLRIAEPMDEVTYLDRLRLDVIDLPPGVDVFPDERFATSDPPPTQERLFFRERFFARKAVDHRGRDVTAILRERDGKMTGGMEYRSWLGFAGEHFVELDFGDQLAKLDPKQRLFMVLAGWTDYAFPESIFAAKQAGVEVVAPVLERQGPNGRWQAVCELGFPAGLPRVMTRDVTGLLAGHAGKLRIRANLQIYWDQIFVAPALDAGAAHVTELGVAKAELGYHGMLREVRKPGSPLVEYDPLKVERVPVTRWKGFLTRYGDVTELLAATDDRVVIIGPGDEVTVSFDASKLAPLPAGWSRQFVLRTWGWCKDASPFTATGGAVGPLPFRAMKQYPPGPDERYPHPDDLRKWHTRWLE
jgi:hypothetical protein